MWRFRQDRRRVISRVTVAVAIFTVFGHGAPVAAAAEFELFRVFLLDGSWLVSYGEYARVGEKVILAVPVGPHVSEGPLQVVSVPAAVVDWPRTERYADAVRRAQYAATRGPAEYAALNGEVATLLSAVGREADPQKRLLLAERAQRRLIEFARAHPGYRADELRQMGALVDELAAALRASSGSERFDLQLVAFADPPPEVLLPPPTLQERIAQLLVAARLTEVPAERLSLFAAARDLLGAPPEPLPPSWMARTRALVASALSAELRVERRYGQLAEIALARADAAAARADVGGVEQAIEFVRARDRALGMRRPEAIAGLLAALEAKLAAARQLRLLRDRWSLQVPTFRAYRRAVAETFDRFARLRSDLDDIRRLAGPEAVRLPVLEAELARAAVPWARQLPPPELAGVHDLLGRALELARHAIRARRQAVEAGEVRIAWQAAAAASGSVLLFERARGDLARALASPRLP